VAARHPRLGRRDLRPARSPPRAVGHLLLRGASERPRELRSGGGAARRSMTEPIPPTIEWAGDRVRLIDQRRLPHELVVVEASTVDELCALIADMAIRGAPALGAAGAMGVALAHVRGEDVATAVDALVATRPTAVNLAWGARRAASADDPVAEAQRIAAEDVE